MRISLMADIHANREAFEACLRDAQSRGTNQWVLLGDYVGYGADPAWVVDKVMELVGQGARAILGNHDHAVSESGETMTPDAEIAMAWTRGQLGPKAREFLANLPEQLEDESRLYVHANLPTERGWPYIQDQNAAGRALKLSQAQSIFCGHVHVPKIYGITATGKIVSFRPVHGVAVPLPRHRRWLAVLGSVGQPRDGNPAASYALLDTELSELTYYRVPYAVGTAAAKIRKAGLPESLAERLGKGH